MKPLDIGTVSARSGIAPSALRFYEAQGLISSIGRKGLRRLFDARVLEQLALIALGRAAGLSLQMIGTMLGKDGKLRIDRGVLNARAWELDARIRTLVAMRDGLAHAAACRAPSHLQCPKFRRMLNAAAAGVFKAAPRHTQAARLRDR